MLQENLVLHVGRISKSRLDVEEVFQLTHSYFGFKYEISDVEFTKNLDLVFIYSDGRAEVINVDMDSNVY